MTLIQSEKKHDFYMFLSSNRGNLHIQVTVLDLFPSLTFLGIDVGHLAELAYTELHRLS